MTSASWLPIGGDANLTALLRVHAEPDVTVDEATVHRLLTRDPAGYLAALRQALDDLAFGHAEMHMTPKEIFEDPNTGGDFRLMPCVVRRRGVTTKTVKVIGTNLVQRRLPDQITVGKALVLDAEENHVTHVVDACLLSSARTGACAALALELLAPARRSLLLIGAGRVGYYTLRYALASGHLDRIMVTDQNSERAGALADHLRQGHTGVDIRALPLDAVTAADAVVLATTAREPVCAPPAWGAGLVVSLGADTDHQRELDDAWVGQADIYVDSRDSARYGDLRAWMERGWLHPDQLHTLFDLLATPPREVGRRRLFVSTGTALFDNLTLAYLLAQDEFSRR